LLERLLNVIDVKNFAPADATSKYTKRYAFSVTLGGPES
jgi:hypothetical protein